MAEQKKGGFTLIELLGILVLLVIIGLISFKVIDSSLKKGKTDAYEVGLPTEEAGVVLPCGCSAIKTF